MNTTKSTRREFVKQGSILAGSLLGIPLAVNAGLVNTSPDDSIKIALVGCGGRGTGAAMQALLTKQNVKLVAMADAFRDRLDDCYKNLNADDLSDWSGTAGNVKNKIAVPEANKFTGFDGYKKAIALDPSFAPAYREIAEIYFLAGQNNNPLRTGKNI